MNESTGYRLRSAHGDTVDPRQPIPVDSVEAQGVESVTPTITYNGKAAAGAISINSFKYKPIISIAGDQVASFWGDIQNKVYEAFNGSSPKKTTHWLTSFTETAASAAIAIYDPNHNLENMFESVDSTVKRYIIKAIDTTGHVLYGWIKGVSVSGSVYTFEVCNNRLTETRSWVGSTSDFVETAVEKVEIYHYNSSLVFNTGTCATEEVACPKEYSKNWENPLVFANSLTNGQYFIDYMRARVIVKKADTTASETITYNIWSSTTGTSGGVDAVYIENAKGVSTATLQTAAVAIGNGTNQDVSGYSTVAFQITGTFVGTVTFETTNDDTNWTSLLCTQVGANTIGTIATAPGIFRASVGGLKTVRARVSAWTSGSITVVGRATNALAEPKVVFGAGVFNATPTVRTEGQGGPMQQDANGNTLVSLGTDIRGERSAFDILAAQPKWNMTRITTATTTLIKTGTGLFGGIVYGLDVATNVTTCYDALTATGTAKYVQTTGAAILTDPGKHTGQLGEFATGLTIVTSQAVDITVLWL